MVGHPEDELSRPALRQLPKLTSKPLVDREGKVPDLLEREVARIERDWNLI